MILVQNLINNVKKSMLFLTFYFSDLGLLQQGPEIFHDGSASSWLEDFNTIHDLTSILIKIWYFYI